MAFNINDFLSHINNNNEVSKAAHFDVIIAIPPILQSAISSKDLSLVCEVSSLPRRDIAMIEYKQYAFVERIPHFNNYEGIMFSFICTGDMMEKKFFDQWMETMVDSADGLVAYPWDDNGISQYHTTIICNQYDQSGNLVYNMGLIDAIPLSIGAIVQNWQDDSINRLQVTFAYKKWTSSVVSVDTVTTSLPSNYSLPSSFSPIQQGTKASGGWDNPGIMSSPLSTIQKGTVASGGWD